MKKLVSVLIVLVLLAVAVAAQDYDEEFNKVIEEDIYEDIGEVELEGNAGLTPDSNFYFLETLVENVLVGDNPETALEYKEEKILELKEMVDSGDKEAAEKALERVDKYNEIIKNEVSPELDTRVRGSSKAVKAILKNIESELEGEGWDDIKEAVDEGLKEEDRIALAAKISNKIAGLCRALSNLDPLEYSKVCKTDDEAPRWKRDLDRELTEEQEKEAKEFFKIMSECFDNPNECQCNDISVKPFADQCNIIAPLAAKCETGDEQACEEMEKAGDPIDLLPDYLQDVMMDLEDRYGDAKHDLHVPRECVEAGAESKEECMKVMFKMHAPPECRDALESGEIDPENEHEARKQCDAIMFDSNAPTDCIDAGITDFRECDRLMFQLDAPQECLDAGLTGDSKEDWGRCEKIKFKLDAPPECLDAGLDGTNHNDWRECEAIRFKLDSPQECLDAGLDGTRRNDWKECNKITFMLDAPEECHQFADDRDPWKSCEPVRFKLDAPQECLDAGLDGTGRDDWRKCDQIRFKLEAPQECLDAGLTGKGRRDWDECHKIQGEMEGERREDCAPEELHICDPEGKNCRCTSDKNEDCGAIDCQQGYHCEFGQCFPDGGGCGDCASKCPGSSRTDCINDKCECYYDDSGKPEPVEGEESECNDGCHQECGDQNTDCVDGNCVCLGYGPNGPPTEGETDPGTDGTESEEESGSEDTGSEDTGNEETESGETTEEPEETSEEPEVEESEPEPEPEPEPEDNSGGNEITGGAVTDFLKNLFN